MSRRRTREKRNRRAIDYRNAYPPTCTNCGQPGRHYVPPSLGEPGFFYCEAAG